MEIGPKPHLESASDHRSRILGCHADRRNHGTGRRFRAEGTGPAACGWSCSLAAGTTKDSQGQCGRKTSPGGIRRRASPLHSPGTAPIMPMNNWPRRLRTPTPAWASPKSNVIVFTAPVQAGKTHVFGVSDPANRSAWRRMLGDGRSK